MTLTLTLPSEMEARLIEEAERQGMSPGEYTLQLLQKHLQSPQDRRAALVKLVQSWIDEGDAEEQKETGDYLIRVLDEDRPSQRKLFPPDLKGVSW